MKVCFSFSILVLISTVALGQDKFATDFTNPKSVVSTIFEAAKSNNYDLLNGLCDPDGKNDADTKSICNISKMPAGSEREQGEFAKVFATGKLTGDVEYLPATEDEKNCAVPFWYDHPGGEDRSNETMRLVEREGKWYLSSF